MCIEVLHPLLRQENIAEPWPDGTNAKHGQIHFALEALDANYEYKVLCLMPATRDGDIDLIAPLSGVEYEGLLKE